MSRFNTVSAGTKTTNLAGGQAYSQTNELELVSILLTSFANDQFYRSANDTFSVLKGLIAKTNPKFVAKAAIYARTKFGMRSISHVVASELAKHLQGAKWAKEFYNAIVYRPDDMSEIISYHLQNNGKLSNPMKKGFAEAFGKFDKYQLAKYKGEGKSVKLVDVVNMVHPTPTDKNREALQLLVSDKLKSFDTWESGLSAAGSDSASKYKVWADLLNENKIGYMALLKNLRNISEQAPEMITKACEILVNENLIKKSLVLPFRFLTAFDEIIKISNSDHSRLIMKALNLAIETSLANAPKFNGRTLVVVDVSGSMAGAPSKIASLFASVLVKTNDCDLITFATDAEYRNINTLDSVTTIANSMRFTGGGTNFPSIFHRANKKYDRVIILSDMQGWIGHYSPVAEFNQYKIKNQCSPFVYSFDLAGNGSLQFPQKDVFCLAGFSDKTMDIIKLLETDKNAMVNEINKISL